MTAIRKHLMDFVAVIGLVVVAGGVSLYILSNQRLRIPFLKPKPYVLNAAFTTAQAVVAGQGQTIRVSGVRIGDIGDVQVQNGHAVVRMDIDPQYKDLVHTDATALLRPRTGLKDMFIELDPGTKRAPVAKQGWTLPESRSQPDVNLDEILAALDTDTRDYLQLLISDGAQGLHGRVGDLRDVFRRFEPTHRDLARVNSAVATRRVELRHLITALNQLNGELAKHGNDLTQLVGASSQVFRAFASEDRNLSTAVAELPAALRQTTDTFGRVERFANILRPATIHLDPAAKALAPANAHVRPLAIQGLPLVRDDIRPFVRASRPFVRSLRPAARQLSTATPPLTKVFTHFNSLLNLLGYNPGGAQGPGVPGRQEGYLFWAAWLQHIATQLFSMSDANGVFRPVTLASPCASITQILQEEPQLEFLEMLTPILTDSAACGATPGGSGGGSPLPGPLGGLTSSKHGGAAKGSSKSTAPSASSGKAATPSAPTGKAATPPASTGKAATPSVSTGKGLTPLAATPKAVLGG
jgi:phospholipid/cholesterol/gamma-HCH transport system substrate-binding protein